MNGTGLSRRAITIALVAALPLAGAARADTLDVPAEHATIQGAIVAAQPGDTVLVAPGTYVETIDFLGKAITVKSSGGSSVTTIDGNGAGSVVSFVSGEPDGATLRGFAIRGGTGSDFSVDTTTWQVGGGIKIVGSRAEIEQCTIADNSALDYGGGIFVHNASGTAALTLTACLVEGNSVTASAGYGGGLYSFGSDVTLSVSGFFNNVSNGSGGGFAVQVQASALGDFSATSCDFSDNIAALDGGGGWALLTSGPATLELQNCLVLNNGAQVGGGLVTTTFADTPSEPAVVRLTRVHLRENTAVQAAGASLYASSFGHTTVSSSVIADNQADAGGGGLVATGLVDLLGSTIMANSGGGLRLAAAQGLIDSCIIWGNEGGSILHDAPVPDPIWCDIEGGFPGTGNIDVEPQFNGMGSFHLAAAAACVDAGNPGWAASSEQDIDGQARVQFGRVDMGADEAAFASGPWTFLGHALAGATGQPSLSGAGALTTGSTTTLTVGSATPNRPLWLIVGVSDLFAGFKGGVLVPAIGQVIGPLGTGPSGAFSLHGAWPAVPSGFVLYLQGWISDPSGPVGFTATNGLSAQTQ